ncbi:hypothetical protein [Brevundimonas sp.]|uniref:hypothetical protein n=1 Tax=Brevundimonas sp. TaxID=1871086 RepID=UPI002ED9EB7A
MISHAAQLVGMLVLMGSLVLAIAFLRDGDKLSAFFCATMTLVSAAFIILAGWMRKRMKVWSDKFPPSDRYPWRTLSRPASGLGRFAMQRSRRAGF